MSYIKEFLLELEEECKHDDHDGHACLICGADVSEKLMCEADWYYDQMID